MLGPRCGGSNVPAQRQTFAYLSVGDLGPRNWPIRCAAICYMQSKEGTMTEAKLAPNLPDWMVEHANRYLASGGTDGHMFKRTVPGLGEITAPALLLTTTGRKSGDKFIFPLFYGTDGGSYFVIASKRRRAPTPWMVPQHPRQLGCGGTSRDQEGAGASQDSGGRGTSPTLEKGARILAALRRLPAQDRTSDTGGRAGPSSSSLGYRQLDRWMSREHRCAAWRRHGDVRVVPETRRCQRHAGR